MRYFNGIKTLEELKKVYRELCKVHHPDLGGDVVIMQAINAEYETALAYVVNHKGEPLDENNINIEKDLMEVIQRIIALKGLIIEVCGRWIWVTGDTYTWKDQLKALKFFWASQKKAWYWRSPRDKCFSRRRIPLPEIRIKYGSIGFETEEREAIA